MRHHGNANKCAESTGSTIVYVNRVDINHIWTPCILILLYHTLYLNIKFCDKFLQNYLILEMHNNYWLQTFCARYRHIEPSAMVTCMQMQHLRTTKGQAFCASSEIYRSTSIGSVQGASTSIDASVGSWSVSMCKANSASKKWWPAR